MKLIVLITLAVILSAFVVMAGGCDALDHKPEQSHDVAVTDMSAPSSCVQGDTVHVIVTVENQGNCNETFVVTLTDVTNNLKIGSQSVTLSAAGKGGIDEVVDVIFDAEFRGIQVFGQTSIAGDVNGDGYDDLLLSCPRWNEDQGRAYLYLGGKGMIDPKKTDVVFVGENSGDFFSADCDMGDVNGDGCADIVIGALGYNNANTDVGMEGPGRAYLFYGGPNMDTDVDVIFDGEAGTTGGFGSKMDIGYIDADNYADILINANYYDNERGRAYLFYGGDPVDTTADKIFDGEHPHDRMGREQDMGKDVNGDGYGDIVFGARAYGRHRGRAYLFYGGPKATMDTVCDKIFAGESVGDEFGSSICICDIDRDDFAEVIVGARKYGQDGCDGRVYLYWGEPSIDLNKPDLVFEEAPRVSLGGDRISCGHFNDDQYRDIAVSGYDYPNYIQLGRVYLYYGNKKSLMDTTADHHFTGHSPHSMYGYKLNVGDFNGDGYDDLVCGAPWHPNGEKVGRAYLYYNNPPSSTDILFYCNTTSVSLGEHILKAEVVPVAGEEYTADNTKTATVNVKAKVKEK